MNRKDTAPGEKLLAQQAHALFAAYRSAYMREWQRLENNERMYRGDHWYDVPQTDPHEPRPVTPVIQSTIENVSADLMDQCPQALITPESGADSHVARVVEAVIARNHDVSGYPLEYRKLVHDLLVGGYCVQEVGYDPALNNGLGGAYIRSVDNRSILFDPLCDDMQEGRAVFKFSIRSRQWIEERYPEKAPFIGEDAYACADAPMDETLTADRRDALLLLEYWWKTPPDKNGRSRVHMALLCGGAVLEDSRRQKPEGYFAHGQYPFVLTPLYVRKGSCLGFGIVDLFEKQQRYADKLDQIVLKNAFMASRNKLLVTQSSGFDEEDLKDWSKEVHRGESLNGITWFSTPPLPSYLLGYIGRIREDIKEESGANDSSRGNFRQGVTAASAIQALQEASTKRARMATEQLHKAFRQAVRMEIEVEREFNFYLRPVTITENGESRECLFDSAQLLPTKERALPMEFFISVKASRQNKFAAAAQNELVLQLMQMGALRPRQAVELMLFEGKEQVLKVMDRDAGEPAPVKKNRKIHNFIRR